MIACLGLSYKPDVDDLRESPAVRIVEQLAAAKIGKLLLVEPHVDCLPKSLNKSGLKLWDFDQAVKEADILLLLVAHKSFADLDRNKINDRIVIDTCGIW